MLKIGLIREGKIPSDNRVALTPQQCKWMQENKNISHYCSAFRNAMLQRQGIYQMPE